MRGVAGLKKSAVLLHSLVSYLGGSEINTIPVGFVDLTKLFPPVPGRGDEDFAGAICRSGTTIFAVMVAGTVSNIFSDIFHVMNNAMTAKCFRPGRDHVLLHHDGVEPPVAWIVAIMLVSKEAANTL
jgi:hypothetical protein